MSTKEKCPKCGATSPVVQGGICGGCWYGAPALGVWTPEKTQEFIDDWNNMVATVARFSAKYHLPKGEMIFAPEVHTLMNSIADTQLLGTIIWRGVRVRFGRFEHSENFRSL